MPILNTLTIAPLSKAETYITLTPQELFDDLAEAARHIPDNDGHTPAAEAPADAPDEATAEAPAEAADEAQHWTHSAYTLMARTFRLCLDQQTAAMATNFIGPFAKTDYLLKEHNAPTRLRHNTNATRIRLAAAPLMDPAELAAHALTDLRHLAQFFAHIFRTAIPETLASRFAHIADDADTAPAAPRRSASPQQHDYLRAIVDHTDERHIYCTIDTPPDELAATADGLVAVRYNFEGQTSHYDTSYLARIVTPGSQLNLVHPAVVDGEVHAEFIIYEPDYLVDITTVARCFEKYAESPYVNLVKRLQPAVSSPATILGNFAGQLLDEALHHAAEALPPYAESVTTFFRANAIELLAADLGRDFHTDAQRQQLNIRTAIATALPSLVSRFDPRECIVEPSFFCEMLGLQGRMDMIQMDFRLLLEQKSGKGEYPQGNFTTPRHTEQHYVQLLLYMAVLRHGFRHIYEQNHRELHAFLLYSKYSEPLLGVANAPELLHRAFRLRNTLVWTEMQYAASPDGYAILDRITPDMLNQKHANGTLWQRHTRPQLEALLSPIHSASPLERAYYFRFLAFTAAEHMLSKVGNKTKENSGFAAKWTSTLDEKLQAGNIYDRLAIAHLGTGRIDSITFTLPSHTPTEAAANVPSSSAAGQPAATPVMSNFRVGDIVVFYPYEGQPDIRRAMVYRGSIETITPATAAEPASITIRLRAPQTSPRVFEHSSHLPWAVEHDFIESSYNTMYRGLHSFLSAPQSRRDLVMLQRHPEVDPSRSLTGRYGAFDELSLRVKQARELFLIIGPPGTGKTSFGMLNTLLEELTDPEAAVLVLSFTNRAVDEICSKLVEEGLDFLRLGRAYNTPEPYRPHLLEERMARCANVAQLHEELDRTRVVVATTSTLNGHLALLGLKRFSLAIIDEASQILEPDLIAILSAKAETAGQPKPAIPKFVLIGDHKQLPAVVQQSAEVSRVDIPELNAIGLTDCRSSLFERLLTRYADDPTVTYMLTRQGRMHPDVAQFANEAFYNSRLGIVPLPHQLAQGQFAFIDSAPLTTTASTASPKVNQAEARLIAQIVARIKQAEAERQHGEAEAGESSIGIIVPYRNQIAAIRQAIGDDSIAIDTVERFQGSQRDYIIYGFTVQRPYQLNFLTDNIFTDTDGTIVDRKLNVALTRAKRTLIVIGNAPLLARVPIFARLIEFAKDHNAYITPEHADGIPTGGPHPAD